MTAIFQSHLLSFKNDMYKFGFVCVLGIGVTTAYSIFVNSKINYIIHDNRNKYTALFKKIEQLTDKIGTLTYEREQLLDRIISFNQIEDTSETSNNVTDNSGPEMPQQCNNAKEPNTFDDDFDYGFYENIPCSNYGKETHNYSFWSLK